MKELLAIAQVQAPYGLKGDCKFRSLSGEWDHILALKGKAVVLGLEGKTLNRIIEEIRFVDPYMLVRFQGVNSPEEARKLTGMEVLVNRSEAAPLGDSEYYVCDLQGLKVLVEGKPVGVIRSVWDSGAHTMLELNLDPDRRVAHVPFMSMYVGQVDIAAGTVEIIAPWILE